MKTMNHSGKQSPRQRSRTDGFSLVELVLVMFIMLVVAGFAIPNVMMAVANARLRGSASDLAGLMQQARILAAKNNPQNPPTAVYPIRFTTVGNARIAYVDMNNTSTWDLNITINGSAVNEPGIQFGGSVVLAAGAPTGTGGQPTPYVLVGDSSTGGPFTNANILAFTSRGLPCDFTTPPTCNSPAPSYFVYYLTDSRVGTPGWAAVVVTKGGRTKVVMWNGTTWN
jgi:prepilin-type N-terminal cleavage/methylation domain-containing protein